MNEADFQFPQISPGTFVVVSAKPDRSDKELAMVTRSKSRSADVMVLVKGLPRRLDCLHADDPQVITRPGRFEREDTGVFVLTDTELRARAIEKRLASLEIKLGSIEATQMDFVDRLAKADVPPSQAKRTLKTAE